MNDPLLFRKSAIKDNMSIMIMNNSNIRSTTNKNNPKFNKFVTANKLLEN